MFNAMLRTGKNGTQGQRNPDGRTYSCPSNHKNSKSEKWTAKDAI
jgi:predicted HAD superfamily Cof-like phosphohydrolase